MNAITLDDEILSLDGRVLEERPTISEKTVLYEEQSLTSAEKEQARKNIGLHDDVTTIGSTNTNIKMQQNRADVKVGGTSFVKQEYKSNEKQQTFYADKIIFMDSQSNKYVEMHYDLVKDQVTIKFNGKTYVNDNAYFSGETTFNGKVKISNQELEVEDGAIFRNGRFKVEAQNAIELISNNKLSLVCEDETKIISESGEITLLPEASNWSSLKTLQTFDRIKIGGYEYVKYDNDGDYSGETIMFCFKPKNSNEGLVPFAITKSGKVYYKGYEMATKQDISNIDVDIFEFVSALPTENISYRKIYFVPDENNKTGNKYNEWVYKNDEWEQLGSIKIDLDVNNIATKNYVDSKITHATSNDIKNLRG